MIIYTVRGKYDCMLHLPRLAYSETEHGKSDLIRAHLEFIYKVSVRHKALKAPYF